MKKRPTIKDVAHHAGVSKSTVSLVLQNSHLVKARTRETVKASIRALRYVRNRAAASLRGSGTGLIGLVVNDLRNPFFTEFAVSAQMALAARGYVTIIANTDENPDLQDQVIRSVLASDISALLISPCYGSNSETFDAILDAGVPTLQVLRHVDYLHAVPFFSIDNAIGSHLATQHLLDQGLRHIAFVGGQAGRQTTRERVTGYRDLMDVAGSRPLVLHGPATRAFGDDAMIRIFNDHPDIQAAVCLNDLVALGMATACTRAGRTVGRDFFIVGFGDIEECAQAHPTLSSVHCDIKGFGERSAAMMLDWLEHQTHPPDETRQPVHLEIRQSSVVI